MSETPQETLEQWCAATESLQDVYASPKVRDAIRAVLAEKHIGTGQRSPHVLAAERALRQAEAERDALRESEVLHQQEGNALRAEVERLRGLIVALVPPPPPERARAVMRALIREATALAPEVK